MIGLQVGLSVMLPGRGAEDHAMKQEEPWRLPSRTQGELPCRAPGSLEKVFVTLRWVGHRTSVCNGRVYGDG